MGIGESLQDLHTGFRMLWTAQVLRCRRHAGLAAHYNRVHLD
jgi:hypothetical protein